MIAMTEYVRVNVLAKRTLLTSMRVIHPRAR